MAKKRARRIRYVARARRRRHRRNPGLMGIPLWVIGGGIAAFLLYKKTKSAPATAPTKPAVAALMSNTGGQGTLPSETAAIAGVGGVLASTGLGSLG